MKKILFAFIALMLLACTACDTESEVSKNAPQQESSAAKGEVSRTEEASEDPLATEEWETSTKKDGKTVLSQYTKVFDGSVDNYTITTLEYTDDVLTGKVITIVTDGKKAHDETYRYNGDTLIFSNKSDYTPDVSVPAFSHIYSIAESVSEYAYYESEMYFSEDGVITEGFQTNYNKDGTTHSTEKISQKELDGYVCRYSIITTYESGVAIDITHIAYDRNMNYYYTEKRTADDVVLYTKKSVDDIDTYIFPEVGSMSVSGTEYEFFGSNGNTVAKGRIENNMINLYENTSNLSAQEVVNIVGDILDKANELGILKNL